MDTRASPSLMSNNAVAGTKRKRTGEKKFYAVKEGKKPGIYNTWDECLLQVRGHKGAIFKAFQSLHEAQAFVDGKNLIQSNIRHGEPTYYAVQSGKVPGVYTDWPSAQAQIRGVKNPKHKKFASRAEAEAFVKAGKKTSSKTPNEDLTAEEETRRLIVRESAPGLVTNGTYAPKDRDGNPYELGRAPLPPGAEDGFDPNIKLAADGTIVNKTEEEKLKTKTMTKDRDPPGMLRIYTDGSSLKNGQAGARAGVGVFFGPQDPKNLALALEGNRQTNNRAELTAIQRALDVAPIHRDVTIYTDSKYSIDCVTNWYRNWQKNGWMNSKGKPVENKDLVADIREKIEEREMLGKTTYFVWVKGHANDPGNIAADRLAVQGALMGRGDTEAVNREEGFEQSTISSSSSVEENDEENEVKEAFQAMEEAMENDDETDELDQS